MQWESIAGPDVLPLADKLPEGTYHVCLGLPQGRKAVSQRQVLGRSQRLPVMVKILGSRPHGWNVKLGFATYLHHLQQVSFLSGPQFPQDGGNGEDDLTNLISELVFVKHLDRGQHVGTATPWLAGIVSSCI